MKTVNVHDAKTHLSRLLKDVQNGEEVIIARKNVPVAKLIYIQPKINKRKIGSAKGQIKINKNFFEP